MEKQMAKHSHSALPSFAEVLHDFGFQLATVREPRLTQEGLAVAVNKIANKALVEAEFAYDDKREDLEKKLSETAAAMADSKSVEAVDGKLVKDWERGRKFPTDAQYKHIKLAFAAIEPLTPQEEEKLDAAFKSGKVIAKRGQNTEAFGDTFDEILAKRMIEMKPPAVVSHNEFADYLKLVGDSKEADKLRADHEAAQKALDELKPAETKKYFLVDGEGKQMPLVDAKGNLALNGEHLRMIEHGIIPSGDLFETIKESLGNVRTLGGDEKKDLESKYSDLIANATAHFRTLKARGIIDNDPFEGTLPNQQPAEPEHTDPIEEEPLDSKTSHATRTVYGKSV
jgi:hypothetical protein